MFGLWGKRGSEDSEAVAPEPTLRGFFSPLWLRISAEAPVYWLPKTLFDAVRTDFGAHLTPLSPPEMCRSSVSSSTRRVPMTPLSLLTGAKRLSMILLFVGALLFAATPALSQELRDRGRDAPQERSTSESTSPNLPDWAAPSNSRISDPQRQELSVGEEFGSSPNGSMETNSAPPPPPREQVPVDGGLALLAAAGAGYAVRRLNDEEDEEDESP